ncbi:MAG: cytochrome c oxidase subunit II [Bdellovibrionota bacterium]|nr:MAG: cytochrome c oxidase subunit II [Bdellovibrionota bacterium]
MFRMMPEQASEVAPKIDWLIYLITDISVFFTVLICGAMIYFAIRYRQRDGKHHETPQIKGDHLLEMVWTIVPTIICIYVAYYGVKYFYDIRHVPLDGDVVTVNVQGQKWKWDFEYDNGKKTTGEAVIPVGQHVKFVLTSRDVLHSFFVPAMRVKTDAIPGRYTYAAFKPVKTGTYQVFCTEYCGKDHSMMLAKVRVVSEAEYKTWLDDKSEELALLKMTPPERGRAAYNKHGCNACHSLDGSRLVGPSFLKAYGREGTYDSGKKYAVDHEYIRQSIYEPNAHIVDSYPPNLMPNYTDQVSAQELDDLIAFIRSLDGSAPVAAQPAAAAQPAVDLAALSPIERGKLLYQQKICVTCHSIDGSKLVGPSFKGIYGATQKHVDGSSATVDEGYIRESILQPGLKVAEGYQNMMPPYEGQLSEEQIKDISEFIKSLK